jgi:hypothetical protein
METESKSLNVSVDEEDEITIAARGRKPRLFSQVES